MINAILTGILNLIASLIQIVTWFIWDIVKDILPDFSNELTSANEILISFVDGLGWVMDCIPTTFKVALIFVLGLEIARLTIWQSTHKLLQLWNLFRKLKFW